MGPTNVAVSHVGAARAGCDALNGAHLTQRPQRHPRLTEVTDVARLTDAACNVVLLAGRTVV